MMLAIESRYDHECVLCANIIMEEQEHDTQVFVHSTLAQPVVHNECAGMCLENVLNVVRGVHRVCVCVCVFCVLCCVSWCVLGVVFQHHFEAF